jgi:hypothetical protein
MLKDLSLESEKGDTSDENKAKLWKRITLSFKSSEGNALLLELEQYNAMLEQLSRAATQAKLYEKTQEARRAHATFEQRDEAERLFHVLRRACRCRNLTPGRDVALRLQVPGRNDDEALESKFQMLLFDSHHAICELSARITRSDGPEPPKKRARFQSVSSTTSSLKIKNMTILKEICHEARRAQANNSGLQLYVDSKEDVYSQQEKPTLPQLNTSPDLLSLTTVMSRLQLYEKKKWLHREKSILAVTLAYSLLRLHDSPWLETSWSSDSISFIDDQSNHSADRFQLRRPFTRSQVKATPTCPSICSSSSTLLPVRPTRRNAHLHALGVVLLELYLNRSIEPDVADQIATYGSADYRGVAIDLLEEHSDEYAMTAEYNRAIRFCLSPHPNPYSGSFSFEDQGFREIFYNEVIVNLEDNFKARFEVGDSMI